MQKDKPNHVNHCRCYRCRLHSPKKQRWIDTCPQEIKNKVIFFFLNQKNNQIASIAANFNMTPYQVDQVIIEYLNLKKMKINESIK